MPQFRTRLINSEFDVTDDGVFHDSMEEASRAGILAAIEISKTLFAGGEQQPHIEVVILEDDAPVARHVVTVSVADVPV